ncbi:MAG: flagellar basal body P-ring formation chaperone FlgA [SAR324 cluster bacterium]|nr:flagellar basal body P-ring formation chaperone FlgA [SAR324 cluster bacterium]
MNKLLRIFSLLGVLCLAFVSPVVADGIDTIEVRILKEITVTGDDYRLGDIAELDGFNIEKIGDLAKIRIGRSPLPGKSVPITSSMVKSRLNRVLRSGQYKLLMPKSAQITRSHQMVSAKDISAKLHEIIEGIYKEYDEVRVNIRSKIKDQYLPEGKASFQISRVGKADRLGGHTSWKVQIMHNDKKYKTLMVRAKVDVIDEVVVAKGKIQRGDKIAQGDLVRKMKNISQERTGFSPGSDLVVGQQAKRDINRNEALKANLVEEPVIVDKGAPIKIFYRSKSIYLTNLGVAMKAAKRGDLIPVRILANKKTIYAIVRDEKMAEVAL